MYIKKLVRYHLQLSSSKESKMILDLNITRTAEPFFNRNHCSGGGDVIFLLKRRMCGSEIKEII